MRPQTILFDLDDTLIHCNKYYELIIQQFIDQMQTWFGAHQLSASEIKAKQSELDINYIHLHGFSVEHFPLSFVGTYLHYANLFGRLPLENESVWLTRLGNSVFDSEIEPYPDMVETLTELQRAGHHLVLYTGGAEQVQWKKIKAMQLETFFADRVFIRGHKNVSALEGILLTEGFDRAETWMIGNSLRTDVAPALELGIHSIHVAAFTEWDYNIVEIVATPKGAYLQLGALKEVPPAINNYMKQFI
ncbi:HAD family hydrolase [Paenibacillus psychroresistens]|uniref:HAD family hydrolase n=1 Tax=Paenibacillus psychroresistens TaxID=1778678 RepID=A0A6B8RII7_9BACL|nr:HAD family hydrolase [Paenibacillus psychroresistens]QGQ95697.1 HAD family hydrolase [Paenibacillus psychroresistens]